VSESGESILDRSFRPLAVFFLFSGVSWLLIGTLLASLAASKIIMPEFLGDCEWLIYGRLRPAFVNALLYGWGGNLAFGASLWLLARLSWSEIPYPGIPVLAGMAWNGAVTLGVLGILAGHGTPFSLMEMPEYVSLLLYGSFLVLGTWSIIIFHTRAEHETYVTQWYALGAVFWFGLTFFLGHLSLFWEPVRGTVQAVVASWFAQNILWLWLVPVAFGIAYYLVPKKLGVAVRGYSFAFLGFATLVLVAPWSGLGDLRGGPLPEWIPSVGSVMAVALFFPVTVFASNVLGTACTNLQQIWEDLPLRFIVAGTLLFTVCAYLGVLLALPVLSEVTQFTLLENFEFNFIVHGLFTMVAFGLSYYWLPVLFAGKHPPDLLIVSHFWVALCGVSLVLTASVWGGLAGGSVANLGAGDWMEATRPFHLVNLVGESLLFASAILFAVNLHWAIGFPWQACCPISGNQETEPIEAIITEEPEEVLTGEELAAKNSMALTTKTFILATILVLAFAGVVYSLIL
jgi:cytochrome c oxidase cbb3-type subunit 1